MSPQRDHKLMKDASNDQADDLFDEETQVKSSVTLLEAIKTKLLHYYDI